MRVQSDKFDAIIGAIYHPPKPIYLVTDLLCYVESCLETIARDEPTALVVLAGDFNGLTDNDVVSRTALTSLVNRPTRGSSCLDRIYANDDDVATPPTWRWCCHLCQHLCHLCQHVQSTPTATPPPRRLDRSRLYML